MASNLSGNIPVSYTHLPHRDFRCECHILIFILNIEDNNEKNSIYFRNHLRHDHAVVFGPWTQDAIGAVSYTHLDVYKRQGLPSSVFITCCPVIDASGTIWFGNSKGLIYLTRDLRDIDEENSYPLAITDVYVNGKEPYHPAIQLSLIHI